MKSPIISITKNRPARGFLVLDALIAAAFMMLIIPAALTLSWSADDLTNSAQKELDMLATSSTIVSDGTASQVSNGTTTYAHEFGKYSCAPIQADPTQGVLTADVVVPSTISISPSSSTITSTSLVARNGFIYLGMNSSVQSLADLFIIDARTPNSAAIIAQLNTGPGIASLAVAGHYVYVANQSTVSQLQVIDILNRAAPVVVASVKLPLSTASTTGQHARSIFYADNRIYLGTEKWAGTEFSVINVSNPLAPFYLGGFHTNTVINDIYVNNGLAYVADADTHQIRVLDVHDPTHIVETSFFSPAGSDILEGKSFGISSSTLYFGRSGGGFNNPNQYEFFSFDLFSNPTANTPLASRDIPGGVYGIALYSSYVFLATHDSTAPIQIWINDMSTRVPFFTPAMSLPSGIVCDRGLLYAPILTTQGFEIITPRFTKKI